MSIFPSLNSSSDQGMSVLFPAPHKHIYIVKLQASSLVINICHQNLDLWPETMLHKSICSCSFLASEIPILVVYGSVLATKSSKLRRDDCSVLGQSWGCISCPSFSLVSEIPQKATVLFLYLKTLPRGVDVCSALSSRKHIYRLAPSTASYYHLRLQYINCLPDIYCRSQNRTTGFGIFLVLLSLK